MISVGPPRQTQGKTRLLRHQAVLERWPVLNESWAMSVERSRDVQAMPGGPPPGGIDPLTAINRRMGLPDDHGRDAVQQAQETPQA
ncbi:MAG: hypothetical protein U0Y82_15430 [Thermoleophilia bacterium]